MNKRNKFYIIAISASTLIISGLHYATSMDAGFLHSVLMDLYYIPVLVGAMLFGLRGAAITYLSVLVLYCPYIFFVWHIKSLFLAEDLLHALFFGVFAIVAGFLVDRERRYRQQSEKDAYLVTLGRVAATIAHELRNSLTVIMAFAQRIRDKKGNADDAITAIANAANSMHKIMDSTLDFAKPLQLTLQEEDILAVIKHALEACKAKAEYKGANVVSSLPPEPLLCNIDSFHIERALVNLIDNAIDASVKDGTLTVAVNTEKEWLWISIKDNGSGMNKETLQNIFMPFYTTKTNGTGIGMAITKKIIDYHKGKIHIESKPGQGTEIAISLPYLPKDE